MAQIETVKSKWLREVEEDAIRIQTKRFRDQFEEMEYQKNKREEEKKTSLKKGDK